jgi:hypothetical protein
VNLVPERIPAKAIGERNGHLLESIQMKCMQRQAYKRMNPDHLFLLSAESHFQM